MGSYFKGWTNTLPYLPQNIGQNTSQEVFIGHVLEVYYDQELPAKIRVRLFGLTKTVNDDDVRIEALPSNLSILKIPLPGEVVLIIKSIYTKEVNDQPQTSYYYITTLSTKHNISYNSSPYIGQLVPDKKAIDVFTPEYETRFLKKISSVDSYIVQATDEIINRRRLKPYEGDILIQSRFGAGIRFGGSGGKEESSTWSTNGGDYGNPIVVMSVDSNENNTNTTEDINSDNASVYLCTTQAMPINVASSGYRTHLHKYDINKGTTRDVELSQFLQTTFVKGPAFWINEDVNGSYGAGDGTTDPTGRLVGGDTQTDQTVATGKIRTAGPNTRVMGGVKLENITAKNQKYIWSDYMPLLKEHFANPKSSYKVTRGVRVIMTAQAIHEGFYEGSLAYRTHNPGNIGNTDSGATSNLGKLLGGMSAQVEYIKGAATGNPPSKYPALKFGKKTGQPKFSDDFKSHPLAGGRGGIMIPGLNIDYQGELGNYLFIYATGPRVSNGYLNDLIGFFAFNGIIWCYISNKACNYSKRR